MQHRQSCMLFTLASAPVTLERTFSSSVAAPLVTSWSEAGRYVDAATFPSKHVILTICGYFAAHSMNVDIGGEFGVACPFTVLRIP